MRVDDAFKIVQESGLLYEMTQHSLRMASLKNQIERAKLENELKALKN